MRHATEIVKKEKKQEKEVIYLDLYPVSEHFESEGSGDIGSFKSCIGRLVIGFSQWIKKEFGAYPKREKLIELGRMSGAEREEHTWFGLYLWETRKEKKR